MGASASANGHSSLACTNQVFPTSRSSALASEGQTASLSTNRLSVVPPVNQTPTTSGLNNMPNNNVVSCEMCDIAFTFFKRKKLCKDCHRFFCSSCLPKPRPGLKQSGRQCDKCTILISGKFTRQQLSAWRVKDMRCFLDVRNIPTVSCREKHDLIDLVLLHFCLESQSTVGERQQQEHDRLVGELADRMRNSSFYTAPLPNQIVAPEDSDDSSPEVSRLSLLSITSPSSLQGSQSNAENIPLRPEEEVNTGMEAPEIDRPGPDSSQGEMSREFLNHRLRERQLNEMREAMERLQEELSREQPDSRPGIKRATLDDLKQADDADTLTVRQLKEILVNNFVDYKGCCEKHELVDRVKRLWNEAQANKQRTAEVIGSPAHTDSAQSGPSEVHKGHDPEENICKVCMDAAIDCILLECGHMVTCTKCGKRLADCPMCRQYITRVVHVFRS